MHVSKLAFDPIRIGFPFPMKERKPRRVQKGDGHFVVVFHTSRLGVQHCIADIDVIVNDGINQPGCKPGPIDMKCNHHAAFILRELIVLKSDELLINQRGFPFALTYNLSDEFSLEITNPPANKSGRYYLHTWVS